MVTLAYKHCLRLMGWCPPRGVTMPMGGIPAPGQTGAMHGGGKKEWELGKSGKCREMKRYTLDPSKLVNMSRCFAYNGKNSTLLNVSHVAGNLSAVNLTGSDLGNEFWLKGSPAPRSIHYRTVFEVPWHFCIINSKCRCTTSANPDRNTYLDGAA